MPPKPDNTSMASNTPRRSHQSPHSWHIHRNLCLIHIHLCPFPSAKRKTIHKHLWLHWLKFMTISSAKRKFIYEHLWLHWWSFLTKKKREAQNHLWTFIASLIEIYDHFQREAQIHLWTFMASFMIIFDPKKARSAKHLWLHWWSFLTKKSRITRIHPRYPSEAFRQFMTLHSTYKTK